MKTIAAAAAVALAALAAVALAAPPASAGYCVERQTIYVNNTPVFTVERRCIPPE